MLQNKLKWTIWEKIQIRFIVFFFLEREIGIMLLVSVILFRNKFCLKYESTSIRIWGLGYQPSCPLPLALEIPKWSIWAHFAASSTAAFLVALIIIIVLHSRNSSCYWGNFHLYLNHRRKDNRITKKANLIAISFGYWDTSKCFFGGCFLPPLCCFYRVGDSFIIVWHLGVCWIFLHSSLIMYVVIKLSESVYCILS